MKKIVLDEKWHFMADESCLPTTDLFFIFKYHFLIQNSKYNNLLFLVQEMDSGIPQCPKGTLTKELELIWNTKDLFNKFNFISNALYYVPTTFTIWNIYYTIECNSQIVISAAHIFEVFQFLKAFSLINRRNIYFYA